MGSVEPDGMDYLAVLGSTLTHAQTERPATHTRRILTTVLAMVGTV